MIVVEIASVLIAVLLLIAAATDVAYRVIPDWASIAVAVLGAVARLISGHPKGLLISAGVAAVLFILLLLVHARGAIGGGDVKLIAAICLGFSPFFASRFIFITAMAGGVLGVLHLLGRRAVRGWRPRKPPPRGSPLLRRVVAIEIWRLARHGSLPYGVAIACGGIWTLILVSGN